MLTNPTYQQAKDAIFATGTIPDGYNGHTADAGFALAVLDWAPDEMSIIAVWSHGWFRFLSKPRTETSEGWAMGARLEFIHLFAADVAANPASYKIAARADPYRHAEHLIDGLTLVEIRQFTHDLRREMRRVKQLTGRS